MFEDDEKPYFCWDRSWTTKDIRNKLKEGSHREWVQTVCFILREAKFCDVWQFITPAQVQSQMTDLTPYLGKKKGFWIYIFKRWNELGIL